MPSLSHRTLSSGSLSLSLSLCRRSAQSPIFHKPAVRFFRGPKGEREGERDRASERGHKRCWPRPFVSHAMENGGCVGSGQPADGEVDVSLALYSCKSLLFSAILKTLALNDFEYTGPFLHFIANKSHFYPWEEFRDCVFCDTYT